MIIADCVGITLEYEDGFYYVSKNDGVRCFQFPQTAINAFSQEINMALMRRVEKKGIKSPTAKEMMRAPDYCEESNFITDYRFV